MIVMKFGGSSLESPEAIRRVRRIIQSHIELRPVVIVSAIGRTTNQLLSLAEQASKGHGYQARKTLNELQDLHYRTADDLVCGLKLHVLETALQKLFRELHTIVHELTEEGVTLTPRLTDHVLSFGERLSSEIVAAALLQGGIPSIHLDAREFIVTDDRCGGAAPLYWDTYARLRRTIPYIAGENVVVMGGFIAATAEGVPTTLGRGGSDWTASLVGAGIDAGMIQIWTDVDGMLTCDPRVLSTPYRVRSLSYDEATAMARYGAKVLHPETLGPARRQRIPVTIRNSRNPESEGTCIDAGSPCPDGGVKSIGVKENLFVLEITSREFPSGAELLSKVQGMCNHQHIVPELLCAGGETVYLGLAKAPGSDLFDLGVSVGVEVHLRTSVALLTLAGGTMPQHRREANGRVLSALKSVDATLLPAEERSFVLSLLVPQQDCTKSCELLHREFFSRVDDALFAPVTVARSKAKAASEPASTASAKNCGPFRRYSLVRGSI